MAPNPIPSATFENRWHNANKEQVKNAYTIFPSHLRSYQKSIELQDMINMKHLYQYLRLLLWRILDAIDRKLGPGPGDHRL